MGRRTSGSRTGPPGHAFHRYLMQHPTVLRIVTRWRYLYFSRFGFRPLQRHLPPGARGEGDPLQHTLEYNLAQVRTFDNRRSFRMIKLVSCINAVNRDGQVLFVGPRNEADLLTLYAFGFAWDRIRGFDLFSYSPKIDIGDMHELPYEDDSFDIAFSSWALTYSDDPLRACRELVRVTRPGGIICVGCEYDEQEVDEVRRERGPDAVLRCWFANLDELRSCFGAGLGAVLWQEQAPIIWMPGDKENLTLVFRVAPAASRPADDRAGERRPQVRSAIDVTHAAKSMAETVR